MSQIESIGCLGVTVLVFALLAILGITHVGGMLFLVANEVHAQHGGQCPQVER